MRWHLSVGIGRLSIARSLTSAACTGIWHCGETVIKEEGVRALWKGLTPFAVHLTLKYALRMGTNALYQSLLRDEVRFRANPIHYQACITKDASRPVGGLSQASQPERHLIA